MPMNEESCIASIEDELTSLGFNLSNAEKTKGFISTVVKNIIREVQKGTVNVTVTGSSASGGPVTGTGTGTVS